MKKNRFVFIGAVFLLLLPSFALGQDYWAKAKDMAPQKARRLTVGSAYWMLNQQKFEGQFSKNASKDLTHQITLINEKGETENFALKPVNLLAPALAERYPQLKNYVGQSMQRPEVRLRLSVSPLGINAWLRFPDQKDFFIQPVRQQKGLHYSYVKNGQDAQNSWECKTETPPKKNRKGVQERAAKQASEIRTFRIALAATAEYTAFWGDDDDTNGTNQEDALAAMVSSLNRVNEIYEEELQLHLELVTDTTIVYTDPMNDPFTNDLNKQLQATLDDKIGSDAYDVGHLFGYGEPNGDAGCLGCVCVSGKKGSAFSSHSFEDPFGGEYRNDYFDLDYFGHELGHQFGAYHTFSFQVEGYGFNAEPGSGSTIMGYAGIAGEDNVQRHGDSYFHFYSIQNINEFVAQLSCGTVSPAVNIPPQANAGADYYIPTGTAYTLEVENADPTEGIRYSWEQLDSGKVTQDNFGPQNAIGPQNRSLPPTTTPYRIIPKMTRVLADKLTQTKPQLNQDWETVSEVGRLLRWGLTVRKTENEETLLAQDEMEIKVVENSGPFQVISQTEKNTIWEAGTKQSVFWEAGTTFEPPINTTTVSIYLSENGGKEYPYLLVENTANDGQADIIVPDSLDLTASRIKIKADNSIYFALNKAFIKVQSRKFTLAFDAYSQRVCSNNEVTYEFDINRFSNYDEAIRLAITNLPAGLKATFSKDVYQKADSRGTLTLNGLENISPNNFTFEIMASSSSLQYDFQFDLELRSPTLNTPVLLFPPADDIATNLTPQFEWEEALNADLFVLQIAKDEAFQNMVKEETVSTNQYGGLVLEENQTFYWRVKAQNDCGSGRFSEPNRFKTSQLSCLTIEALNLPSSIADATIDNPKTTSFTIPVGYDLPIEDLNVLVAIEHNWLEDLTLTLVAPDGTSILLTQQLGENRSNYENTVFDAEASQSILNAEAPFEGTFAPIQSFESLYGKSAFGDWTLEITDSYSEDSGTLNRFEIEFCLLGITLPNSDRDSIIDEKDNCPQITNQDQSDIDGNGIGDLCDVFSAKNITVTKNNVSCAGKFNGRITLSALAKFDYLATLKGPNGVDRILRFSGDEETSLLNLGAGRYAVCVSSEAFPSYSHCFDVQIKEPDPLDVQAVVQNELQLVELSLKGGEAYEINWNGKKIRAQVTTEKIQLPLEQQWNRLEVKTALACQGVFETWIANESEVTIFPNPVQATARVLLPAHSQAERLLLYDTSGNLIWETSVQEFQTPEFKIPVSHLPTGLYVLSVRYPSYETQLKLIKE